MLSKHSLQMGRHLAVALENYDLSNPRETVYDDAVRYSLPVARRGQIDGGMGVALEAAVIDIEETAGSVGDGGFSAHDAAVSDAAEIMMAGLVKQFNYVRSTVLPVIGKVSSDCLERVKNSEPKEYEIVQFEASDLLKSGIVKEVLKKYTTNTAMNRVVRNGPERDAERLINGMKTGIAELDEALANAIGKYGTEVVLELYNGVFRNEYQRGATSDVSAEIYRLLQKNSNGSYSVAPVNQRFPDLALILYFLVDSLVNDPLEATGLGLKDYETAMIQFRHAAGFMALQAVNRYEADVKRGVLVIHRPIGADGVHFSGEGAQIVVYGEVYRYGQERELTTEVVIGGALQRDSYRLLTDYLQRKDVFLKTWELAVRERELFAKRSMTTRLSQALIEATAARLAELPDDQFPGGYNRQEKAVALRQHSTDIAAFFKDWDTEDAPNVYDLVCDKLCRFIFDFVDAKFIIDKLEEEMASDENISPENAAFVAAAKYLMAWAAANYTVTKA